MGGVTITTLGKLAVGTVVRVETGSRKIVEHTSACTIGERHDGERETLYSGMLVGITDPKLPAFEISATFARMGRR